MLQSIFMMGGLGVAIGTVLVIASKAFYVYEDPKVVAIDDALPGANCGGCGYPGCNANAEAIVNGIQDVNSCVAAGDDVALAIAEIMGVSVSDKEPEFAGPGCFYGKDDADMDYIYRGVTDCRAAALMFGGMKVCRIGCLGLGTCVKACMFDALSIGSDGLPKVNQKKCTGCGACEKICPKNIIRLTSVTRRIIREYTKEDCTTPCQRACPTGIDIKEYIRLIKQGDYEGSVQVIKERNPFPTVISRICPAPCESKCRRLFQDESVAINNLKRFVCDYEMTQNKRVMPYKAPATGKKVAIIGGGVEGLSTAFFSARLGHDPTVFEITDKFGGILRKAIDRKRLSMDVLDWDIEGVKEMGVTLKANSNAGKDFTIDELLAKGFDSVFTATGGWDSRLARGEADKANSVFPGAYLLIDLLRSQSDDNIRVDAGKRVVIAGDTPMVEDAVTILKTNGAQSITLVSRKNSDQSSFKGKLKDQFEKLGVTIIYNAGVTKVSGEANTLRSIEYVDFNTGEKQTIDADTLIIGSGRFPELVFIPKMDENEQEEAPGQNASEQNTSTLSIMERLVWEGIELQKKPDMNKELGLLSGQDVISDYASVVAAINGGRKAAAAIHYSMYNLSMPDNSMVLTEMTAIQNISTLQQVDRSARNLLKLSRPEEEIIDGFSTGFSKDEAHNEADRCLRCGLICYEKSNTP